MTRHGNQMKLKSTSGREEEDLEIEEAPVNAESIGRPAWWFTGSLFTPKTIQERKLATLQYQTLTQTNPVLSSRAQRIRQFIGVLSYWFPLPILDEIGKDLLIETDIRQKDENLLAHILGGLELTLRKRHITIRWDVLQGINQTTGYQLKKGDIYRWMFYTCQQKKERLPDTLRIIQHLTLEEVLKQPLSTAEKRQTCQKVVKAIKILRNKGFICKDPEIASWSLKRIILEEKSVQKNIPRNLRTPTTRITCRIKKMLE
ncbi:MAG: hypothetical protein ACFFC7_27745 [Candidatus Hermodarchaeota archaeon]